MLSRYRGLFALEGFHRLVVSAVLARLPSGMFSLAILLFVRSHSGSFLIAGVTVGAFTLSGALCSPLLGGAVDRLGQARVLLPAAVCQVLLLAVFLLLVPLRIPTVATVALAAVAGAALPPVSGCIRALWPKVARDPQTLELAYSLDAISQEVIYTTGPLLAGAVAVAVSPGAALALCALVSVGGTLLFASSPYSRAQHGGARKRSGGGVLAGGGVRVLLVSSLFGGCVVGAAEVGLPALALHAGSRASAGVLLALFSVGSMLGGVFYGARAWRAALAARYVLVLVALELAMAPLVLAHSLLAAIPLSAFAGLGVAPMLSCQFSLMSALAPADATTEAFSWHRAATVAGIAAGSAIGGGLVDAVGPSAAFALGCTGAALAAVFAVGGRRLLDPTLARAGRDSSIPPLGAVASERQG
ncbi:MAG TPA: MFS transporter [Solirubrobacteraceae bacterium]|nr:MFS transporter [Solirubrobacteraceae bacterium]